LFTDYFIRSHQHIRWDRQADLPGVFQIDDQLFKHPDRILKFSDINNTTHGCSVSHRHHPHQSLENSLNSLNMYEVSLLTDEEEKK